MFETHISDDPAEELVKAAATGDLDAVEGALENPSNNVRREDEQRRKNNDFLFSSFAFEGQQRFRWRLPSSRGVSERAQERRGLPHWQRSRHRD